MNKHLALAYGFAGLAVAAALITFVTTSTAPEAVEIAARIPEEAAALDRVDAPAPATVAPQEAAVEYVYVDEPARAGRHDEHGDEDDEHDERGDDDHDDDEREGDDDERGGHDDDAD